MADAVKSVHVPPVVPKAVNASVKKPAGEAVVKCTAVQSFNAQVLVDDEVPDLDNPGKMKIAPNRVMRKVTEAILCSEVDALPKAEVYIRVLDVCGLVAGKEYKLTLVEV